MAMGNGRFPPLNALRAFEAAARHLSFKKAAQELHVTPGAVSHQAMLPKVREGLDALHMAVARVKDREDVRSLTVVAPPNFAARWLVPRLSPFTEEHPELELHVA